MDQEFQGDSGCRRFFAFVTSDSRLEQNSNHSRLETPFASVNGNLRATFPSFLLISVFLAKSSTERSRGD